jgi:hypothetical protein
MRSDNENERYARHLSLPEIGPDGQKRLLTCDALTMAFRCIPLIQRPSCALCGSGRHKP